MTLSEMRAVRNGDVVMLTASSQGRHWVSLYQTFMVAVRGRLGSRTAVAVVDGFTLDSFDLKGSAIRKAQAKIEGVLRA